MHKRNEKKLQSSIEFVVIMAAVASMSVVGLSYYSHVHSLFMQAISLPSNSSNSIASPHGMNNSVSAYIFAPELQIGNASELSLLVTTSMPSNVSIRATGTGVSISPSNLSSQTQGSQALYSFYVSADNLGSNPVSFNITARNGSIVSEYNLSAVLYAYDRLNSGDNSQNSSQTSSISNVYLKPKSEALSYKTGKSSNLYYITESSHCSELNFWGQQMPIQSQCGGASWYFWYFSGDCYYGDAQVPTMTYCVYKHYSGYNASAIRGNPSYLYNVTMGLRYKSMNLSANVASSHPESSISGGTAVLGLASAGNSIYAQGIPQGSLYLVSSKSGNYTINNANYSAYEYAYSNIEDDLAYYNNSGNGNLGTINREIYSYNNTLASLISMLDTVNSSQCTVNSQNGTRHYSCKTESPMQFYNASIRLYNYTGNQSEYSYMGSDIWVG